MTAVSHTLVEMGAKDLHDELVRLVMYRDDTEEERKGQLLVDFGGKLQTAIENRGANRDRNSSDESGGGVDVSMDEIGGLDGAMEALLHIHL
ncbi:MAG: hypothetical protein M1836_007041 [Candelina mexicana]|nr:MAG: hypothetical protein M1836_007041 [Candelina mexicana]